MLKDEDEEKGKKNWGRKKMRAKEEELDQGPVGVWR